MTSFAVVIPEEEWREVGQSPSQLLASIKVNGYSMHLNAYELAEDANGRNVFVDSSAEEAFGSLEPYSWPTSTMIHGRSYALIATPYGQ